MISFNSSISNNSKRNDPLLLSVVYLRTCSDVNENLDENFEVIDLIESPALNNNNAML